MEHLTSVELSIAGRPTLYEGEVELKICAWTQLMMQRNKQIKHEILPVGVTLLTNCRCIFIISQPNSSSTSSSSAAASSVEENMKDVGYSISLGVVSTIEDCAKMFSKSTRISLYLHNKTIELGIKFHQGEKEAFMQVIHDAITKKSWFRINMNPVVDTNIMTIKPIDNKATFSSNNAGISGILRKQEKDMAALDSLQRAALSDLNSLMKCAEDVVKVVRKYSTYLEDRKTNNSGTDTESVSGDVNEIEELLQNIGMVSPVTKLSAGRSYYHQLARQIADLLLTQNRLLKIGGMITLPDLYCVVNRSRGTELLSPDDLYKACNLVDELRLGIHFKRFPSGVMIMQLEAMTEAKMCQRIVDIFHQHDDMDLISSSSSHHNKYHGMSVSSVAVALQMSVIVTKELLLQAERSTRICRDDCNDGMYFYLNLFSTWSS